MSIKKNPESRREFLKTLGISIPVIGVSGLVTQGCESKNEQKLKVLFDLFRDPPEEAKPFFRWWWNGNNVTREEVSREIGLMKESGAGGIEINPIAMPRQLQDPPSDGLVWLSPEWCDMVRFASDQASDKNMITDLIVGTGWPFGGEFLDEEETIKGLTIEKHEAEGPGIRKIQLKKVPENEKIFQISLIPDQIRSIDEIITIDVLPGENDILETQIPEGKHVLIVIRIKKGFREVFRGAPGGAGPVLDHFNSEAVSKYLNNMSGELNSNWEENIDQYIRAMFCDSIELEGANWTSDLPEEFERRRGYSVLPYLPLLMMEDQTENALNDEIKRVRYDYSKTLAQLFEERFIHTFHQWCKKNKLLSRYQAYGHPWLYTDLVDGYLIPDIPEGDQWLFNAGWANAKINQIRYAIWNKYASSGGHLANSRIISSEAMTNTRGVFQATLEYMKQAADLNFVGGINHFVLHGFNYSPPDSDFPGWVQYGTYFNEKNTWWPYLSHFMKYTARISSVLQNCTPVSQVAIMGPTADVWREAGLDRNRFNTEPWYLHSLWQSLSNHGISSDYINGMLLQKAIFRNGKLQYGKMSYDALILCGLTHLEEPVARSILQYVESGGKVILLDTMPSASPGLKDHEVSDNIVKQSLERAVELGANFGRGPGEKEKKSMEEMTRWTGRIISEYQLKSGIQIKNADPLLFTSQYEHNKHPVIFISNVNTDKDLKTTIILNENNSDVWRWDPESGERTVLKPEDRSIELNLDRLESALLVMDKNIRGTREEKWQGPSKELMISGTWNVTFIYKTDDSRIEKRFEKLQDISHIEDLKDFSGTAVYRININVEDPDYKYIDTGTAYDLVELTVNGKPAGIKWYGKKRFYIAEHLNRGENSLEIKVTNTLYNYCLAREDNPEIAYWLNRSNQENTPLPAGLIGPVRLLG